MKPNPRRSLRPILHGNVGCGDGVHGLSSEAHLARGGVYAWIDEWEGNHPGTLHTNPKVEAGSTIIEVLGEVPAFQGESLLEEN